MSNLINSPPRAPPIKYKAPLGTRWEKEKAAAGNGAFDYPDDAKFVGPWVIGECVGKGASGHVKIAKHRRTGQLAAVKILPIQPFANSRASLASQAKSEKQRLGVDREITMMKLMNHPNIMRIYDVYEGEKELYLILEYVEGGELFDFLVNRGKLAPLEALGYFKQIVYGLNYAHTFSIIHRDLKPENILIHSLNPPLVKIADWGMAAFAPPTLQLETSCGSPHYASPEIVNGHRYTGTATDIWSCGVILYALLTGRLPFDDKNVRTLLGKVKAGRYEMPTFIDPVAKDLLARMLVVDVRKRITMTEVLAHPWLEGFTPGIVYVPAPPVSELARPLPSASHIDRDLFQSLCVIWGRHCDANNIKADLLSPAGEGTLAKAFYFLLHKHREQTMEEHGILMDDVLKSPGKVVMKQYTAPKARPRNAYSEIEPVRVNLLPLRATRGVAVPPPHVLSPTPLAVQIPVMERTPSRPHPPSPVGPRPPRPRPTSSPAADKRPSSMVPPSAYHRNYERQRLHSGLRGPSSDGDEAVTRAAMQMSNMIASLPHHSPPPPMQRHLAFSMAPPPTICKRPTPTRADTDPIPGPSIVHAPIPIQASPQKILPMIAAPKVQDQALQRAMDQYASMVNVQATNWNALRTPSSDISDQPSVNVHTAAPLLRPSEHRNEDAMDTDPPTRPEGRPRRESGRTVGNKENIMQISFKKPAPPETTGGLGFGSSVPMPIAPMSKEMANLTYINGMEKKDKGRQIHSPAFDLLGSPNLQKRPTFSMLGPMSPPASTLLGSPAVGEFKGWFSNLFHWKVQSYLLHSVDDVVASRNEALRILESLGVSILEDHFGVLKCRADDIHDGSSHVQKQMRFRVEVAPSSTFSQSNGTPRLSQNPMSPQSSSIMIRSRSQFERIQGYETVIVLILEKGSVTTFRAVHQRLKAEWRLDALQSPRTTMVNTNATPILDQRVAV
ncbi:hypothetical protein PHLCEN_2v7706 [Hermanssonia centrifuga]|uniref:Protein kinase domain-containing protein n=1 Tax=Hermanssonia centrifuga TaxID=98765 RepID=A0A2R6NVU0_9APHY|nr:hypothetical protein PHLCEN_2v7706 [Hermanssonia centrifuga]